MFRQAKWIWVDSQSSADTYGEFYDEFIWHGNLTECKLSCDSDYTLFINGRFVASNQYGDYEWYKAYDSIDITSYLQKGNNSIAVLVWHFGVSSQRYLQATAGLIFEIREGESVLLASGESTRARYSKCYRNGAQKLITRQLGFSFSYDSTKEDGWQTSGKDFSTAVTVEKECRFIPRPIEKLQLRQRAQSKLLVSENNRYLIDLGKETVGLPILEFTSPIEQNIRVDWGEDLQNGHVRRLIQGRDFSFDYVAKKGKNEYVNYMLRLGCRYLEIYTQAPIRIAYAGLLPQYYPTKIKPFAVNNSLEQRIYDVCVDTLQLSMMEHYVDTPWREQCLYVFDSRNQMLCGYYAFEGKNAEYARSNLKLISQDRREDGLLSICTPCGMDLTIPSFSLYYFMAIREYVEHTGDVSLAKEVYPKLRLILEAFLHNRKDGLVYKFQGVNHWNFYDWSPHLDGQFHKTEKAAPDLIINLLFILALDNLREIDNALGNTFVFEELYQESKRRTKEAFYRKSDGAYAMSQDGTEYTALGNALAILVGLVEGQEAQSLCEKIAGGELIDCSLSMKCFKYDALLATDSTRWGEWIRGEIRREYGKMLEEGATTVWETIDGASAFGNAGSLCHGWSAIPVYYLQKFTKDASNKA